MTRKKSLLRMIIFWPKNATSPLLSLNRSWLTDPTSRLRSTGVGRRGLVCDFRRLPQLSHEALSCSGYLVCEGRVRIVYDEDGTAQVVDDVQDRKSTRLNS